VLSYRRSNGIADNALRRMDNKSALACPSQDDVSVAFEHGHTGLGYSLMISGIVLIVGQILIGPTYLIVHWIVEG
jgi:hypothetical protein